MQSQNTRKAWSKTQLQQTMASPHLGSRACQLCADGEYPNDLQKKVGTYETCADIHLKLSLVRYDNQQCPTLQDQYRDLCCPDAKGFSFPSLPSSAALGPPIVVLAGVVAVALFARKLISARRSRSKYDNKRLPTTKDDVEAAAASSYKRMEDAARSSSRMKDRTKSPSIKTAISLSRNRSKSPARLAQSRSRDRKTESTESILRGLEKKKERAQSRSRDRQYESTESILRGIEKKKERAQSRSRDRKTESTESILRGLEKKKGRAQSRSRDRKTESTETILRGLEKKKERTRSRSRDLRAVGNSPVRKQSSKRGEKRGKSPSRPSRNSSSKKDKNQSENARMVPTQLV